MSPEDIEYFRARAAQEREVADSATDPATRAAHLALATKYEALAESGTGISGRHFGDPIRASQDAVRRSFNLLSVTERNRHAR